ncbi:hypothetical protein WJX73_006246 [Symbiochloris irregularis]|uniref:Uncharacterized protein n=1 Tax=Symbiochloris irregularis TaxID=706552 RepID=A0AAW1PA77_9CHLO
MKYSRQVTDDGEVRQNVVSEEEMLCHRVPGYYSFHLEGCEMFFPEDEAGRLSLTEGKLVKWDDEENVHSVQTQGEVPTKVWQRYSHAVWMAKYDGDTLNYKDPEYRIDRIYLIARQEDKNDQLDFNQVYRLDHKTQNVRREAVRWNTQLEDPSQHIMRIRDDEIIIEDFTNIPSEEDIVADFEDSQILDTLKKLQTAQADLMDTSSLADPIDARKDAEVDENSPDDTPASDMI